MVSLQSILLFDGAFVSGWLGYVVRSGPLCSYSQLVMKIMKIWVTLHKKIYILGSENRGLNWLLCGTRPRRNCLAMRIIWNRV